MPMLRATIVVFTFGVIALFGANCAHRQTVSLHVELLKDWLALNTTIPKIADEMPAGNYGFRPTDAQQTFGKRTVHIAIVNMALLSALGEPAIPKPTIDPKATTKDAALKALDDSFDYGIALLKQQSDQTLLQPAGAPPQFLGPSPRERESSASWSATPGIPMDRWLRLRLNGRVPPASQRM
jgi:hypothetical protein